ncbi:hypothetical protein CIG75_17545 [Tumebacillus algifaecis]|uniref:Uncharacterized protein n=1 Tax=Tumebacillus algifaecis TaxID=1214604 RepID=A0A223D4P7_9BACL|nr:hypothetical protein CIG75_17545 [Tumebacillus algifaecis]
MDSMDAQIAKVVPMADPLYRGLKAEHEQPEVRSDKEVTMADPMDRGLNGEGRVSSASHVCRLGLTFVGQGLLSYVHQPRTPRFFACTSHMMLATYSQPSLVGT